MRPEENAPAFFIHDAPVVLWLYLSSLLVGALADSPDGRLLCIVP